MAIQIEQVNAAGEVLLTRPTPSAEDLQALLDSKPFQGFAQGTLKALEAALKLPAETGGPLAIKALAVLFGGGFLVGEIVGSTPLDISHAN